MRIRVLLWLPLMLLISPQPVVARTYPAKPIRFIVPFPAGSTTDARARIVGEEPRKGLGQPIVIENKPGADGIIAAQAAAQSPPDGYTAFIATSSTHAANLTLFKELPEDARKDFLPVAGLIRIARIMCVRADFPANDVKAFVEAARRAQKPLSFGGALLKARLLDMGAVPMPMSSEQLGELVASQIPCWGKVLELAGIERK